MAATKSATTKVEELAADAQKTMTEGMEKMSKGFEDMTAFGQENIDAMTKSAEIAAKAFEGIGSEVTTFTKKSFEDGVAAAQDLASAKNMTELFEKQSAFVQHSVETMMGQATKMNEICVAAAKDIMAPLTARFTAASEAVKSYNV